jgi:hypothetical protein
MHYSPSSEQEEMLRQNSSKSVVPQFITMAAKLWTTVKPHALTFTRLIWNCLQTGSRKGIKALLLSVSFIQKSLLPQLVTLACATWAKVMAQDKDSLQPWYRRRANIIKLSAVSSFLLLALFVYVFASAAAGQAIKQLSASTPAIIAQVETSGKITIDGGGIKIPSRNASSTHAKKPQNLAINAATPTSIDITMPTDTTTPILNQNQHQNQTLSVSFTSLYGNSSSASATVHTLPGAALTIRVVYCSGAFRDTSNNLYGTAYADNNGDHTWSWSPSSPCTGTASVYVTANYNGQAVSIRGDFTL